MRPPLYFTRPSIVPEIVYAQNDFPDMLFDNKMFVEAANSVFIVFVFYQKSEVQAVVDLRLFDFITTRTFVHYKFSPLIRLFYPEFGLSYKADEQKLRAL
jgi:hypothetical protein